MFLGGFELLLLDVANSLISNKVQANMRKDSFIFARIN